MLNLRVLEIQEFLDDDKVIVDLDGVSFERKIRRSICEQWFVKINNREFLIK